MVFQALKSSFSRPRRDTRFSVACFALAMYDSGLLAAYVELLSSNNNLTLAGIGHRLCYKDKRRVSLSCGPVYAYEVILPPSMLRRDVFE